MTREKYIEEKVAAIPPAYLNDHTVSAIRTLAGQRYDRLIGWRTK